MKLVFLFVRCAKIVNIWTSDGGGISRRILKLNEEGNDDNRDATFFLAKSAKRDCMRGLEVVDKGVGMRYSIKSFITKRIAKIMEVVTILFFVPNFGPNFGSRCSEGL